MDKNTEKYLRNFIKESLSTDVDEMAYARKGVRDDKGKIKKWRPFFKEGNDTEIPDYWICNPTQEEGKDILIVPLDCNELEQFESQNAEWLRTLEDTHSLKPQLASCTRGKYHRPVEKYLAGGYKATGEKYPATEWNNRILKDIVAEHFESEEFNKELNKRSIPGIVARDRKNVSQYGRFDNDKIEYKTHNNNAYDSASTFLKAAIARMQGKDAPEFKTFHMARQYNDNYQNWRADKKMDKKYEGKTEKYMLDAFGLEQQNLDIQLRADFEIFGSKIGENSFSWNVRFKTMFAKKLPEDSRLKGGFLDDKMFQATTTAQLDPNKVFDNDNPIMKDINVVNALIQAIEDVKSQVKAVNPQEILRKATVKQYQVAPNQNIQEALIKRIKQKLNK